MADAPLFFLEGEEEAHAPQAAAAGAPGPLEAWRRRYLGTFVLSAYSMTKGSDYIAPGDRVLILRKKKAEKAAPKGKGPRTRERPDYVVRFSNMRGRSCDSRRIRGRAHPGRRSGLDGAPARRRAR